MYKQRLYLGLTHFAISAVIVGLCFWLLLSVWYPNVMPALYGIYNVLIILFLLNILIWPALSAMLYKLDKKKLKFDLTVMGILQIVFTVVMMFFLWQMRPVWVSFVVDSFEIVREKEVIWSEQETPSDSPFYVGFFEPYILVGASYSDDKEIAEQQKSAELDGISVAWRSVAVVPLSEKKNNLRQYAQPVDALNEYNPQEKVNAVLAKYPQATKFFALKGYVTDGAILSNDDFSWLQPVLLQPWEE